MKLRLVKTLVAWEVWDDERRLGYISLLAARNGGLDEYLRYYFGLSASSFDVRVDPPTRLTRDRLLP